MYLCFIFLVEEFLSLDQLFIFLILLCNFHAPTLATDCLVQPKAHDILFELKQRHIIPVWQLWWRFVKSILNQETLFLSRHLGGLRMLIFAVAVFISTASFSTSKWSLFCQFLSIQNPISAFDLWLCNTSTKSCVSDSVRQCLSGNRTDASI